MGIVDDPPRIQGDHELDLRAMSFSRSSFQESERALDCPGSGVLNSDSYETDLEVRPTAEMCNQRVHWGD